MNVLLTADIHLGDYNDYNYSKNSRLNQFDKLADRLIELGKLNNCEEIWILGDFLRVPNSKSRIQHKLKKFLKKLCHGFTAVRYTLGQHDLDSKSDSQDIEDTIVSIPELTNFIYMNKEILTNSKGQRIAFANWTPSQDLTWYEGKVELLCGHYTKSELFGQDIDEDKFDLMIHGDIHNDQVLGKFVSIGNPIQHDFSSQSEGTCIVLDTETLNWKHIKVDADHTRFLQLHYTDNAALEGFHGELDYYKYIPPIQKELSDTGEILIKWKDIDELISEITKAKNLSDIHDEIKSNIFNEEDIDFNIQLKSLDIIGYRSVVQFHIDFQDNDRIILLGNNGSGKSSILSALKAVFDKSRFIQYEKSDLTDTVAITVKFIYQNKLIELTKGDWYKLVIDGDEQKYNNKTEFEHDVIAKFPFINYLDIFFINAGSSNLSSQLSSARCIELLSKFYRLDVLTHLSNQADVRLQEEVQRLNNKRRELDKNEGALNAVETRLNELEGIDISKLDEFNTELEGYNKIRSDREKYLSWKTKYTAVIAKCNELQLSIDNFSTRLSLDVDSAKLRLEELNKELEKIDQEIELQTERGNELIRLTKADEVTRSEGTKVYNQLQAIRNGVCPTCGAPMSTDESKAKESELTELFERLKTTHTDQINKLNEYTEKEKSDGYFKQAIAQLKILRKTKFDESSLLSNKISQYEIAKSDKDKYQARLNQAMNEKIELENNKIEEIILPYNLAELEDTVRNAINRINHKKEYLESKLRLDQEKELIETEVTAINNNVERYTEYKLLMSNTGEVIEEILKRLATKFSSNEIKYEVSSGVYYGNRFITFDTYYNVKGKWRIYDSLSSGQKQVCDLDFLSNLFTTRMGFLVLDEYLRHLDENNFPKCMDLLTSMKVDVMILATHDMNITNYTKRILLELNDRGETVSKII